MKPETLFCSPENSEYGFEDNTCFSYDDLKLITKEYNRHTHTKISISGTKKQLLARLRKAFEPKCGDKHYCWLDQPILSNSIKNQLQHTFRPPKPANWYSNRQMWLNTYDILNVLTQYEKLYKEFLFLGVFPMDFETTNSSGTCNGICNFSIHDMTKKNKTKFGMVLNTDMSNQPGSHWVSIACNIDPNRPNYGIYFYDSTGNKPQKQAWKFMERIKSEIASKKFEIKFNRVVAQHKNNECGQFSNVLITQFVKDIPFEKICKGMKTDDDMNKLRNVLYRPSKY